MAGAREVYSSGDHEQFGKQAWAVKRVYAVLNAGAAAFAGSMWNARAGGYPRAYAPRCRRIRRQTNWQPGISKVTLFFKTVREPGKAKLLMRLSSNPEKVQFDQNGLQLDGPIHTTNATDGLNYARVISGSNIIPRPTTQIVLQTAYERSGFSAKQITETMAMVGKINKSRLQRFGNFLPGTLLLLGAPSSQVWDEDDLWYVNYVFGYAPTGWNHPCQRQVFTKLPRRIPVLDADGNVDTDALKRYAMIEVAKKITSMDADGSATLVATIEEDTVMYEATSFRDLDAMIEW